MAADGAGREAACAVAYRRFPILQGVAPRAERSGDRTVYTFEKTVATSPGGPRLRQIVRVTVDGAGRVTKVVGSK
jgi:hypothetical protein